MHIQRIAGIVFIAVAATACSSGSHRAGPSAQPTASTAPATALPAAELRCADVIGDTPPTAGMQVIADAVALPSLRMPALQAAPTGDSGSTRLFAKWGLLVRAKAKAVLTVADPGHVSIGWGNPGPVTKRFVIPGCGSSGWLAFAGGYYVDRPRCITLEVTSGTLRQDVLLGVGEPCPGQRPPPVA